MFYIQTKNVMLSMGYSFSCLCYNKCLLFGKKRTHTPRTRGEEFVFQRLKSLATIKSKHHPIPRSTAPFYGPKKVISVNSLRD